MIEYALANTSTRTSGTLLSGERVRSNGNRPKHKASALARLGGTAPLWILAIMLVLAGSGLEAHAEAAPDKASPFTAVRWEGDEPLVRFDGRWYHLEALDDLGKADILAFARETYGKRWKKRFSEDLVEVLTGMGHQPAVEVKLVLQTEDGERVETAAQMTEDNRRRVWRYNQGERDDSLAQGTEAAAAQPGRDQGGSTADRVARQYAEYIDQVWDRAPSGGTANLRFLLRRAGKPLAGKVAMQTEFGFRAVGDRGRQYSQGFNPNTRGRWIYEELPPGTYSVVISGVGRYAGWRWSREAVRIAPGEAPLFEIDVKQ